MVAGKTIMVVGASAGGSSVLTRLLSQLTDDMDLSVMVVLHLTKPHIGELVVSRLQKSTSFKCKIPRDGEPIKKQHVYLAMPDRHLIVKKDKLLLGQGPPENRYRPSIDALFRSSAVAFGPRVIGVILSGMLEDGSLGMHAIRKSGGMCIIQDPQEAIYPDMPNAVISLLKPDYTVPVGQMGEAIKKAMNQAKTRKKIAVPKDIVKEAAIAERVNIGIDQMEDLGKLSAISCPACGGSLWTKADDGVVSYRCHVGHVFSEKALVDNTERSTESTLWMALRMLEERKTLYGQIAERESKKGKQKLASTYLSRAKEIEGHAQNLKSLLFASQKKIRRASRGKRRGKTPMILD